MIKGVFSRMESYDAMSTRPGRAVVTPTSQDGSGEPSAPQSTELNKFASQYHTDAYLLFRALCKLSSKTLPGDDNKTTTTSSVMSFVSSSTSIDPLALHSKVLSLELLMAVLEYCGDAFRTGDKFIYAVQNYLCVSLLKNCMSSQTKVAYLSQKIFLLLVMKFKAHLKNEIEVFMSNIFLKVLESPNSSFDQKALVLEALRSLCTDPVLLTQIFLNYDCDFDAVNLYKEIVHNLTKLSARSTAMPSSTASKKEVEQDFELSLAGVEVLVSILRAFLKALALPGGEEEESTTSRLPSLLQIDVGLAAQPNPGAVKGGEEDDASTAMSSSGALTPPLVPGEQASNAVPVKPAAPPETLKSSAASDVAGKIVTAFESKRAAQQSFEMGVVKFTLSLKPGLRYFIDNGFCEMDAKSVALFFIENKDKLDKTQMGEALGREPEASFVKGDNVDPEKGGVGFWFRILNHYVDAFDFTGMRFDDAIREFQSGFRLPGEAQKIDRIMEKFAERFTGQNMDVFPSADTAFILAFSVIMLNTDLHNPNIKEEKKMTLDSFIRNNRGIADGGDLPKEYLTGIFNRIKSNPFSLKEDDEARERAKEAEMLDTSVFFESPSFFGATTEDRKRQKFQKEREDMMVATEHLFKKRPKQGAATVSSNTKLTESINPSDVVKPMFDVTWGPLIGTLSQVLECSNNERSIAVCMNGFVYAVRIAAHSDMSLARDTFVNSLAKFTFLGSVKNMKHKNIESIRTLLSIAVIDGEYLNESWGPVLQCISQLSRLRLFASGLDSDEAFLEDGSRHTARSIDEDTMIVDGAGLFRQATMAETAREAEESNSRAVVAAFNEVLIDKVFSSTVNLSAKSIAHFIEQLVEVSATEIAGNSKRGITGVGASSRRMGSDSEKGSKSKSKTNVVVDNGEDGPRIFSLQRLVEVADYNMDVRPRLAWAQMWEIMAKHFAKIGCHQNSMVSIFAIDSLKQLSFKFLEKPERSEFNFQRIFLRPFLQIMENPGTREDIRELILRCMDNMIRTMSHNLQSGWKIFFSILAQSAKDSSERINTLGLAILQRLLDEHLHQLCRLHDPPEEVDEAPKVHDGDRELTPSETRNRNANVEDFVGLCRASLAFVQTEKTASLKPIGLSMRALCHTACYADLIAEGRVMPPMSGAQANDSSAPGYTYEGLNEKEGLEMVLWRPLFDGLADGLRSKVPSTAGGVGCLVQRGGVLALRAILLRHGGSFTTAQWAAILEQTVLPAMQGAAEGDSSTVVGITSESPSVSSLDFLAEPQRPPPAHGDPGLEKFAAQQREGENASTRTLGTAELLVEASFTDMRHGGDGNLARAYELAKKDMQVKQSEQPFPDSWVATTAPIALGLLTDIGSEVALERGAEGRQVLWPLIISQYKKWAIGRPAVKGEGSTEMWQPCEALVRIACREFHRFPLRVLAKLPNLSKEEQPAWASTIFDGVTETLNQLVDIENGIHDELVRMKLAAYGISSNDDEDAVEDDSQSAVDVIVYTPFGKGVQVGKRNDTFKLPSGEYETMVMTVIKLDFGGTLYRPAPGSTKLHPAPTPPPETPVKKPPRSEPSSVVPKEKLDNGFIPQSPRPSKATWWEDLVPAIKVRCVAIYCIQHYLYDLMESFLPCTDKETVSSLLESLNRSRLMAAKAYKDEDLSHAFQEAMFSEWGDGVIEVEEAGNAGRLGQRRGSEMFFLTQEAGATNNIVHMLAVNYQFKPGEGTVTWDREAYVEPFLLERIMDVFDKFLDSEARDGHLIDPNVWRNASESGGKLAIYCTSFARVVVNILRVMLQITPEQFTRHKDKFFPLLCSLVRVQSDEIRLLVQDVLQIKVAPMIGVTIKR